MEAIIPKNENININTIVNTNKYKELFTLINCKCIIIKPKLLINKEV